MAVPIGYEMRIHRMAYYMSMQSVRFRSDSDYERFKMLFRK